MKNNAYIYMNICTWVIWMKLKMIRLHLTYNDTLSRLTQVTICTNIHVQFAFVNITNFVRQNTN